MAFYYDFVGGSVLIQILFGALYTKLIEATQFETETAAGISDGTVPATASNSTCNSKASICNILAEAICSIDEDNKHTEAIAKLINQTRESQRSSSDSEDMDDAVGLSFVSTIKVFVPWSIKYFTL